MAEYIKREAIKYEQWPVGPLYEPLMVVRKATIDNIPAADVAPAMGWIKCSEKTPAPEEAVLLLCEIRPGTRKYICVGFYIPEHWPREQSDYSWDLECCGDYDEEHDDYFVNEGWYERIVNWDEYSAVAIGDFVTHWMPLPEPPKED